MELRAAIVPLEVTQLTQEGLRALSNVIPLGEGLLGITLIIGVDRGISLAKAFMSGEEGDNDEAAEYIATFGLQAARLALKAMSHGVFTHFPPGHDDWGTELVTA